jgi:DNA polymerase-3 subunit gamma/tau
MNYAGLARKYRPTTFDQIIGQDVTVRALRNAIERDRVGLAYLFVGPSGVGKTATARVFARALGATDDGLDNLTEVDCARWRRVDDLQPLFTGMLYTSLGAKRRVYIFDEVHQLSPTAFSALLKPLEDYGHCLFILATTEPKDIPSTILTRCQRFDFKPIAPDTIRAALERIAAVEGVTLKGDQLTSIALSARGSLRAALQELDIAISYHADHATK